MNGFYKLKVAVTATCYAGFNFLNAQVASTYNFSQISGNFVPITGGTVVGGPTDDDNAYSNLPIGFEFQFNGKCFNRFGMSSNGYVVLGSASPQDHYTMISSGPDDNILAPLNGDTRLGFATFATVTAGSPLVQVSSTIGIAVGDVINSGYGFPPGTSVTNVGPNSFIASTNASSSNNGSILFANGEMRFQNLGTAPNRTLVIQWLKVGKHGDLLGADDFFNFQVKLEETSNSVSFCYGPFANGTTFGQYEVGLRGSTSNDFDNRKTTSDWSATTAGVQSSDVCIVDASVVPPSGLTFKWTTTVNNLPTVSLSASSSTVCVNGPTIGLTGSPAGGAYSGTNVSQNFFTPGSASGTFSPAYSFTDAATGCSNLATTTIVVSNCTDIKRNTSDISKTYIFPNPGNGEFTIETGNGLNKTVSISDLSGRVIFSESTSDEQLKLNISLFASGVYFVAISTMNLTETIKLVMQ